MPQHKETWKSSSIEWKVNKYNFNEEVSKVGYFWTALHFASHYGHINILNYIINLWENNEDKYDIFNVQTTEGKTPLMCALSSGDISAKIK